MRRLIVGLIVGGIAVKLYRSAQAREIVGDSLSVDRGRVRQRAQSLAATSARTTRRIADVIDAAPVPPQARDQASQATAALRSLAANMQGPADPHGAQIPSEPDRLASAGIPDDLQAEQDAAVRAAADASREQQAGPEPGPHNSVRGTPASGQGDRVVQPDAHNTVPRSART